MFLPTATESRYLWLTGTTSPCPWVLQSLSHTHPTLLKPQEDSIDSSDLTHNWRPGNWEGLLTGKSTLTSVPSRRDTLHVMMDLASPAAGMCVAARCASRSRSFSACLRIDRRPSVLLRKLSISATTKPAVKTTARRKTPDNLSTINGGI